MKKVYLTIVSMVLLAGCSSLPTSTSSAIETIPSAQVDAEYTVRPKPFYQPGTTYMAVDGHTLLAYELQTNSQRWVATKSGVTIPDHPDLSIADGQEVIDAWVVIEGVETPLLSLSDSNDLLLLRQDNEAFLVPAPDFSSLDSLGRWEGDMSWYSDGNQESKHEECRSTLNLFDGQIAVEDSCARYYMTDVDSETPRAVSSHFSLYFTPLPDGVFEYQWDRR